MSINYKFMLFKLMTLFNPATQRIMTAVLRHIVGAPTIAMLAETFNMTHVGAWKAVKKLEAEQLIILKPTGTKKNSTYTIHFNWDNPLLERTLALALAHEATNQRRWIVNFAALEKKVDFLILYGSILHSPKEAQDIDILDVVSKKENFTKIDKIILNIQMTQSKKIHAIDFTPQELKEELQRSNKAFLDMFKKGVVLFGQDKFVKFVRRLRQ